MMNLTQAAWVGHDLALATNLGSALFKQVALPKGIENVPNEQERALVFTDSMKMFSPIAGIATVIMAGTWLIGRSAISGRSIGSTGRALVLAKDICVGGAVVTGAAGMMLDQRLSQQAHQGALRMGRMMPSESAEPRAARMMMVANVVAAMHTVCVAGALALTTMLSSKAIKSPSWNFISRMLP